MLNLTSVSAGVYDRRRKSVTMATYSLTVTSRGRLSSYFFQVLSVHVSRLSSFFSMLVLLLYEFNWTLLPVFIFQKVHDCEGLWCLFWSAVTLLTKDNPLALPGTLLPTSWLKTLTNGRCTKFYFYFWLQEYWAA